MKATNLQWCKIANSIEEIDLVNGLAKVGIEGKEICIGFHKNELFACTAKCPHAGGNLTKGFLDDSGNIVCPVHRYKFNVKKGYNTSGEGYFLKTYPVDIRDEGVFIGIDNKNSSTLAK